MPHLSPPTLTKSETEAILRATAGHPRDHAIYSLALGTGLRLAELVGQNVSDVFAPDGTPRSRVRIRPEIAKGGRVTEVASTGRSGGGPFGVVDHESSSLELPPYRRPRLARVSAYPRDEEMRQRVAWSLLSVFPDRFDIDRDVDIVTDNDAAVIEKAVPANAEVVA